MKNTGEGRLEVTAIENGTVIDHIPASNLFKIIRILGLENENHRITFGTNLESKRMGTKAIIKINDRFCKQEEINRIAIVAPMAVVNIIRDFKVVEKHAVTIPEIQIPQVPIIKGDAKSVSIAAASIVAKVTRDRMMVYYDSIYPEYGFASNKGYGSQAHIQALEKYGPSPIHRATFIKNFI